MCLLLSRRILRRNCSLFRVSAVLIREFSAGEEKSKCFIPVFLQNRQQVLKIFVGFIIIKETLECSRSSCPGVSTALFPGVSDPEEKTAESERGAGKAAVSIHFQRQRQRPSQLACRRVFHGRGRIGEVYYADRRRGGFRGGRKGLRVCAGGSYRIIL